MAHTVNVPLARQVLAQIMAAPERWTQSTWLVRPYPPEVQSPTDTVDDCKTFGCFAGWTVVLAGHKTADATVSDFDADAVLDVDDDTRSTIARRFPVGLRPYDRPAGAESVRDVAAARLGLSNTEARALFSGSNTFRHIYRLLERFTAGEIAEPADLPEWADYDAEELAIYLQHNRA